KKNLKLIDVDVPIIGANHAGITILALLSKTKPSVTFTGEKIQELAFRIQNAGIEVVDAKAGAYLPSIADYDNDYHDLTSGHDNALDNFCISKVLVDALKLIRRKMGTKWDFKHGSCVDWPEKKIPTLTLRNEVKFLLSA
ncbi:malate dehydrogenase, chloroplastic, partial [Tanacetum coccineum]